MGEKVGQWNARLARSFPCWEVGSGVWVLLILSFPSFSVGIAGEAGWLPRRQIHTLSNLGSAR